MTEFWGLQTIPAALAASILAVCVASPQSQVSAPPGPVTFEEDILPILDAKCVKCHGEAMLQGNLDVRSRSALLKGGRSGPAVVPGRPEESPLYQRVHAGEMPMGETPLHEDELAIVRRWIELGAPAIHAESLPDAPAQPLGKPTHWAFQPPERPSVPNVRNAARVHTPIDAFVLAELEKHSLTLSAEADRITLARRAHLDLTGLPPTPQELDQFLADRSPDAYEKLVDRLLASPRYAERWARHWLDIAGYADSDGGEAADVIRKNAWRYRDYVVRSFNDDKPYDIFLREQIAGDEISGFRKFDGLPPEVIEKLEATGFLRTGADGTHENHTAALNVDYLWKTLFDTQQIFGSSLLGLTVQCARCHDHKYEPISQSDYYRLLAFFTPAYRPDGPMVVSGKRAIVEATKEEQERAEKVNKIVDPIVKALRDLKRARTEQYRAQNPKGPEAPEQDLRQMFPEYAAMADRLGAEIKEEEAKRIELPSIRALYDLDGSPAPTRILRRGDYQSPGEEVEPGIPAVLVDPARPFRVPAVQEGSATTGRRMLLADWLTQPDHPLTARLMVNRIWAHHFGSGIVPTLENFGVSGDPPTNQALLDWLATEFVRQGWSIKAMHRLMMTSNVYRQSSKPRPEALQLDPENRLLWRFNLRRLEAEIIRDAILQMAGTLDPSMYGEPVETEIKPSGEVVPVSDTEQGRRSIYMLARRSAPQSFLSAFDAPVMETNCTRRSTSTTATQALALMNSEFVTAQAEHFARRVLRETPPVNGLADPADSRTVEHAFRLALARRPSARERDMLLSFLHRQVGFYADSDAETRALRVYADLCQALLSTSEFVYVD